MTPPDHNLTIRGFAGTRRIRHVRKANTTWRVGIARKASNETLLFGARGSGLIIDSRNARIRGEQGFAIINQFLR